VFTCSALATGVPKKCGVRRSTHTLNTAHRRRPSPAWRSKDMSSRLLWLVASGIVRIVAAVRTFPNLVSLRDMCRVVATIAPKVSGLTCRLARVRSHGILLHTMRFGLNTGASPLDGPLKTKGTGPWPCALKTQSAPRPTSSLFTSARVCAASEQQPCNPTALCMSRLPLYPIAARRCRKRRGTHSTVKRRRASALCFLLVCVAEGIGKLVSLRT
jgi:hypothetical protein